MESALYAELAELLSQFPNCDRKTLLLIDETEDEVSLSLSQRSPATVVLDAHKMNLNRTIKKRPVAALLEEARHTLMYAMKYGKILVIRMGKSIPDFLNVYNDDCCQDLIRSDKVPPFAELEYLPRDLLLDSGTLLKLSPRPESLFRREDFVNFSANCSPEFKVILTSTLPLTSLDSTLFNGKFGLPDKAGFEVVSFPKK